LGNSNAINLEDRKLSKGKLVGSFQSKELLAAQSHILKLHMVKVKVKVKKVSKKE
jgi:hypothetical protein